MLKMVLLTKGGSKTSINSTAVCVYYRWCRLSLSMTNKFTCTHAAVWDALLNHHGWRVGNC